MKKRIIMERMVKFENADSTFDLEFWKKIGAQGRFSAAWEMISEITLIRGKNVNKQRLQRSVQNIKQR